MPYSKILFDKSDNVATITLNRPDKSNAFDNAMIAELIDALKAVERDVEIRAVVITGAGKNFCAGQDLAAALEMYKSGEHIEFGEHVRQSYNVIVSRICALDKPVIAAINGAAAGAGLGLACACDLRHASENAKFRMAFIGIALVPDSATSLLLPRLIGLGRATEMALTNELLDAQTALQYGLVNRVFKAEELLPKTREFAVKLAHAPTKSIGLTKRTFHRALTADLDAVLEYEAQLQDIAANTADHREGVQAFIEKRVAVFGGK
jgi:2-(1,2-epoxy-1,2-dihydrophenyl)acetyl-CoA isomerase